MCRPFISSFVIIFSSYCVRLWWISYTQYRFSCRQYYYYSSARQALTLTTNHNSDIYYYFVFGVFFFSKIFRCFVAVVEFRAHCVYLIHHASYLSLILFALNSFYSLLIHIFDCNLIHFFSRMYGIFAFTHFSVCAVSLLHIIFFSFAVAAAAACVYFYHKCQFHIFS